MQPQKFQIEGQVEGGEKKSRNITGRFFLLLFVLVVVGGVIYFPFLQEAFPPLRKITMPGTIGSDSMMRKVAKQQTTIDSLLRANDSLRNANKTLNTGINDNTGLFYEIQIGAFKNFDIERYNTGMRELHAESNGEYDKLTLGKFRDLKDAEDFLKDIKEMGFKDAWIVAKINGQRVPLENPVIE